MVEVGRAASELAVVAQEQVVGSGDYVALVLKSNVQTLLNPTAFDKGDPIALKGLLPHIIRKYLVSHCDLANPNCLAVGHQHRRLLAKAAAGLFDLYHQRGPLGDLVLSQSLVIV